MDDCRTQKLLNDGASPMGKCIYCEDAISRTLRTLTRVNLVSNPLLLSHTHTHITGSTNNMGSSDTVSDDAAIAYVLVGLFMVAILVGGFVYIQKQVRWVGTRDFRLGHG